MTGGCAARWSYRIGVTRGSGVRVRVDTAAAGRPVATPPGANARGANARGLTPLSPTPYVWPPMRPRIPRLLQTPCAYSFKLAGWPIDSPLSPPNRLHSHHNHRSAAATHTRVLSNTLDMYWYHYFGWRSALLTC